MKHHLDPSTCGFVIGFCMEDLGDLDLAEQTINEAEIEGIIAVGVAFAMGCGVEPRLTPTITRELMDNIGRAAPAKVIDYFSQSLMTAKTHWKGGDKEKAAVLNALAKLVEGDGHFTDNEKALMLVIFSVMDWKL